MKFKFLFFSRMTQIELLTEGKLVDIRKFKKLFHQINKKCLCHRTFSICMVLFMFTTNANPQRKFEVCLDFLNFHSLSKCLLKHVWCKFKQKSLSSKHMKCWNIWIVGKVWSFDVHNVHFELSNYFLFDIWIQPDCRIATSKQHLSENNLWKWKRWVSPETLCRWKDIQNCSVYLFLFEMQLHDDEYSLKFYTFHCGDSLSRNGWTRSIDK